MYAGQTHLLPHRRQRRPATLCAQLAAEGFGDVQAVVGQCLGTLEEKIFRGSVKELAAGRFNSLSVLLVEAAEVLPAAPRACRTKPSSGATFP